LVAFFCCQVSFQASFVSQLLQLNMNKVGLILLVSLAVALGNQVTSLPGYNGPQMTQFTGYITVNPTEGKNFFYWLIESQTNPSNAPLVIWFQGGPGCSGLIGLFTEHGPYVPNYAGGLDYNPITWTSVANVLYIEQPAEVGFSYSTTPEGSVSSDSISAQDNFQFIELFLQQYPQYVGTPTWLSGESYAGVYIPSLVGVILNNTNSQIYKQLAGITLGNPVIDCAEDSRALQFNLFYYHGLVSYTLKHSWDAAGCNELSSLPKCDDIFGQALRQIGQIYQQKRSTNQPSLDPDDLYQDFCTGNGTLNFAENTGYPSSCYPLGTRLQDYLNRHDVQVAIGANPVEWEECSSTLRYSESGASMLPYYQQLFKQRPDVRVLVYSGDIDIFTVPFAITQGCLYQLNDTLVSTWQPWFVNGATAGYVEVFKHYTYATLKGAGHEAPQYQPLTAYNLFTRFLNQQNIVGEAPTTFGLPYMTEGKRLQQSRAGRGY